LFGSETDTQDATGAVTAEGKLTAGETAVAEAAASFLGAYSQIPPMYSALKVKGRKLYELARKGVVLERAPRTVTIYALDILELALPERARLRVRCSKGAYMRTLCEDLGRRLTARAHMGRLIRTEAGGFSLQSAVSVEDIKEYAASGRLDELIMPIESIPVIKGLEKARIKPEALKRLLNGGTLNERDFEGPVQAESGGMFLVTAPDNRPAALYIPTGDGYRPKVML
ncbi:MAG: tRNA pseudouridine(55) synthase, partial [Clostridiales bacterium]|jgi:tRNA pseudouridine55 synthase|nr:tRNA pseudouridine(55) synthase [Clostridiales bacterium]